MVCEKHLCDGGGGGAETLYEGGGVQDGDDSGKWGDGGREGNLNECACNNTFKTEFWL